MLKFIKKAEEILSKKRLEKKSWKTLSNENKKIKKTHSYQFQEEYILNTYDFSKKYDINIIYQNIDFIRIKLKEDNYSLKIIKDTLKTIYTYQDILQNNTWFHLWFYNIKLFDKFYMIYSWSIFWNQKLLYDIYDISKNKIWQLTIKNPDIKKQNKNVISSLELSWLFFKCYESYFLNIIDYFKINIQENNIVKRLDYCIDIKWIEVPQILESIQKVYRKAKSVEWLVYTDKKKIQENATILEFWRTDTFKNFFNTHNDLKIYDKILDLVDNYLKRKVDWINPYQDYIDSYLPITRIELKKKWESFTHMTNNSIDFLLDNIEALFFDYLKRYFSIDLSLYIWENISLNWQKLFLAKEEKQKKIQHSYIMAQAYLKNIEDICWINEVYNFLLELYPNIKTYEKPLDEFDIADIFIN